MGTVKFAISSVFRDTGQFNSNRPEQGEGGEKGKGRKVERECMSQAKDKKTFCHLQKSMFVITFIYSCKNGSRREI